MKKHFQILTALLLLTACNNNALNTLLVKGKIYKHPDKVQYLKFKTDSVQYYGDFGNETLNNHTFAYTQKDEVVTVYTPTPEHLLAYEGFVERGNTIYELFANTADPSYQDHQPADPATWSPAGKRYRAQYEGWADTLVFLTTDTLARYHRNQGYYKQGSYFLDYPQLVLTFDEGSNSYYFTFTDTATIFCKGLENTYYLLP